MNKNLLNEYSESIVRLRAVLGRLSADDIKHWLTARFQPEYLYYNHRVTTDGGCWGIREILFKRAYLQTPSVVVPFFEAWRVEANKEGLTMGDVIWQAKKRLVELGVQFPKVDS